MISESRVPENCMPGLMSGDWKRGTVSGPQRLQLYAWTAPDLSTTAPALDSDPVPIYGAMLAIVDTVIAPAPASGIHPSPPPPSQRIDTTQCFPGKLRRGL